MNLYDTLLAKSLSGSGAGGGGGYDAEVSIYYGPGTSDPMTGTIIKGDYATLRSMIDEKMAPNVLVRLWNDATNYAGASDAVHVYGVTDTGIIFSAFLPEVRDNGFYFNFTWASSDVLSVY